MEREEWKKDWKRNWKQLGKSLAAIVILIGVGAFSLSKSILRRIWDKSKEYKGLAITAVFFSVLLLFLGQTLHFKMAEKKQELAFDSLSRYCDSVQTCSRYEAGYAAGMRAAASKDLLAVEHTETEVKAAKKTTRRARKPSPVVEKQDTTK